MRVGLILTVLSLSLLVGCLLNTEVVNANPYSDPSLWIESPENTVYDNTTISVIFHTDVPTGYPEIVKMSYSLDGTANRTLSISKTRNFQFGSFSASSRYSYVGTGLLTNLSKGIHSIDVYAFDSNGITITYPTGITFQVNITPEGEKPLPISNITIILVIAIIAVTIATVSAVTLFKRRNNILTSKQSFL